MRIRRSCGGFFHLALQFPQFAFKLTGGFPSAILPCVLRDFPHKPLRSIRSRRLPRLAKVLSDPDYIEGLAYSAHRIIPIHLEPFPFKADGDAAGSVPRALQQPLHLPRTPSCTKAPKADDETFAVPSAYFPDFLPCRS